MKMPSVMNHSFSNVPSANIPRSVFNRSHTHKTTFNADYLIPLYIDFMVPGSTFNVDITAFARLITPLCPVMDNIYLETFAFACPVRLVWENFPKMCGEQTDPGDSTSYTFPMIPSTAVTGWTTGTLSDYFGLPVGVAGIEVVALWHRMYNLVWNCWFRDENLQNSVTVDTGDADSADADYVLLKRCKRPDYFTSCLPWPQKNATGVSIPLGTEAPVLGIGKKTLTFDDVNQAVYESDSTSSTFAISEEINWAADDDSKFYVQGQGTAPNVYPYIRADLTNATAATINSLREAFALQKMYERDARGGTRYWEVIKSHYGVLDPSHAVLQRPVFLGGSSVPVIIAEVPQTSQTDITPQGNLAATGRATLVNDGFVYSATEHTLIMVLVNVRADITYQQGMWRFFFMEDRWDMYWPALAHLGEDAVLNKEIYCDATANDEDPFGYQERWAHYRYYPSKITGLLRSNCTAGFSTLEVWHLSQDFAALPDLNSAFIQSSTPIDRITMVTSEDHFILDSFIKVKAVQPMPTYSVPGLLDHF